jgi:rfaE bifunctional protein kinase chain/domain
MSFITEKRFKYLLSKLHLSGPIMVLGDLGVDKYTNGLVNRISPEAPVPVVNVTQESFKLGLAANIFNNLHSLNIKSTLCGIIGEDKGADILEGLIEERGLNTWGIIRSPGRKTTFKERITVGPHQICRIDYETVEYLEPRLEEALILEDYAKGTLTENIINTTISTFKSMGKLVAIDPGLNTPPHFYKGAHLLKPNMKEAKAMVKALGRPTDHLAEMAKILVQELEIEKLIITLGPDGMALVDNSEKNTTLKKIPTVASNVFDVSGAGDTAISLLTTVLEAGGTLEEAAWIANCASGIVVGKMGTATTSSQELLDYYANFFQNAYEQNRDTITESPLL